MSKPGLLVLASTYPRWKGDHEPGFVHELSRRLADRFAITVVTSHAAGAAVHEVMDGVEVIRYRYAPSSFETLVYGGGMATHLQRSPWKAAALPGFFYGLYRAASDVLRTRPIAAMHAHWLLPQGLIARSLSGRFGVPYLVTSHGGDLFGLRGAIATRLKHKVAQSAAAMTVVSSAMRDEAIRLGLAPAILEVLPMGVDLESRFIASPSVKRLKGRLLFVGRLVRKKGLSYLLDAMPLVLARCPEVQLDIVGFGPEEGALRDQARRLGIARSVNFRGPLPQHDLPDLYRVASLFVAPFVRDESGDQEGLPVALMEAVGCGCPAVVGDVPGLVDLLGNAVHAISVMPQDRAAFADAIIDSLASPATAAIRAAEIRQAASGRVGWDQISMGYGNLLERLIVMNSSLTYPT